MRIGLSWLFLTVLSFLAFSAVVASLSTFFLSADLRLILVAPVASRRVFFARFARTLAQSGWMVVVFLIPVALGSAVTLLLVTVFPARRAPDILMFMGLVFVTSIVLLLRFLQPERLMRVESMPEVTSFFATLQSPITPLLPSFWAGEALFASVQGGGD